MIAQKLYAICLLSTFVFTASARSQSLAYRWDSDSMLAYQVNIVADLPDEVETLSGAITFKVKSPTTPARLTFSGGLTKTTQRKPGSTSNSPGLGPFGPGFGGPGRHSPLAQRSNPFKGLERTTNDLVIDSRGNVSSLTGSSQLPYLLGNLSLLVFEPLHEGNEKNWIYDSGVTISEKNQDRANRFNPFGPFGPFGNQGDDKETVSAASQLVSFTLQRENGQLATYAKTFQLNSPAGETAYKIDGKGTWTFNRKLGVSETLDFSQKLTIIDGNISVAIPVSIKYQRLSPDEYNRYEKNRLAAIEERKAAAHVANYTKGGYVPPSNLPITDEMKLPVNLLILWKKDSRNYWSGTVVEELSDGTVKAKEVGGQRRTFVVPRGRLQLVPQAIEQPKSISAETLASLYAQAEHAGQLEAARKQVHEQLLEAAKAKPDAPILGEERQQIMSGLRSGNYLEMERALQLVAARNPRKDGELNEAVKKSLEYPDGMLQSIAKVALPKVLPGP